MELSCYSSSIKFKELIIHIYNDGYIEWSSSNSNFLALDLSSEHVVESLLRKDQKILDALYF
jgi:hypothetical protein